MPEDTHHYSNPDITITWKPGACIHSKICWHELREVFDPTRRPWIVPDAATTERIKAQIDRCPSGALSYINNNTASDTSKEVTAALVPAASIIECLPNGPLLVKGSVVVKKSDGTEEIKTGSIALCRCGASGNKPWCDGSHSTVGFQG